MASTTTPLVPGQGVWLRDKKVGWLQWEVLSGPDCLGLYTLGVALDSALGRAIVGSISEGKASDAFVLNNQALREELLDDDQWAALQLTK